MAENPLAAMVLDVFDHLIDNPGDVKTMLDAARSDITKNAAYLAHAEATLDLIQHLAGELMTAPMTVEREAIRDNLEELYHDLSVNVYFLLDHRRQLRQVVKLLLFLRAVAIARRAWRLLPAVALTAMTVSAAVLVYAESRRGVVPASTTLWRIFTRVMYLFLEGYWLRL
ncbi:hypothetical protein E2562_021473 [Oryza meyeriana var. granulata]|uniref:Uncharacterized protein n=1 Tax=Oryza meyeriana var. granulata TaxID=110450 RepID=A0A6G1DZG6_9ORYZ|nr:hypothetical protein E2562_021473 [Oryza meyeriana var. granulata]